MVLNGGDENSGALRVFFAALPVDALDGEVVRFGTAGGENNLGGVRSNSAGDAFAGVFDGGAGVASYGVQGGGVAAVAHLLDHGVDGGGQYVGGGGVVEVDAAVLTVGFCAHGSSCWVVWRLFRLAYFIAPCPSSSRRVHLRLGRRALLPRDAQCWSGAVPGWSGAARYT